MPSIKGLPDASQDATAEGSGWDPRRVWQDRVQMPRLASDLPHDGPEAAAVCGDGWDPFQTWQYRVLRGGTAPGDGQ